MNTGLKLQGMAALVLVAAGLLSSQAKAGHKEIVRLSHTWHLEAGKHSFVLDLQPDRTFVLKVSDHGQIKGLFNATDDEIGLRFGNDLRHFRYALRGGEFLLSPSKKDRRSGRANSLLDLLPPHTRYSVVAFHLHDFFPAVIRPYPARPVVTRPVVVRPEVFRPPVVHRPGVGRPVVVHRPVVGRPVVTEPVKPSHGNHRPVLTQHGSHQAANRPSNSQRPHASTPVGIQKPVTTHTAHGQAAQTTPENPHRHDGQVNQQTRPYPSGHYGNDSRDPRNPDGATRFERR